MSVTLQQGDCREIMPGLGPFDMILADPPYGDTSLAWDRQVEGWLEVARACLKPTASIWVFGSLRFFIDTGPAFAAAGLRYAQDIVWEKHNGSGLLADRFKRVHEHVAQFYRDDSEWANVYNEVQTTPDAVARSVRRKRKPGHFTDEVSTAHFVSHDGEPRLMRSVIFARSCHGRAIHETEKPVDLLEVLIRTSCPPGGLVADFFAGSGAAGDAAAMTGRNYVGTEIDPIYFAKADARLAGRLPLATAA